MKIGTQNNNRDNNCNLALLSLGQMCREARRYRGINQKELSARVNLSSKFISLLETGKRGISWPTLIQVMIALQFNIVFIPAEFKPQATKRLLEILQPIAPNLRELIRILEQIESAISGKFPMRT